jgi:hypothetical protein
MSILIEGPNGAGKTALAMVLADEIGWPYVHNTVETPPEDYIVQAYARKVVDRGWPSGVIYDIAQFLATGVFPRPKHSVFELQTMFEVQPIVLLYGTIGIDPHARHPSQTRSVMDRAEGLYSYVYTHLARSSAFQVSETQFGKIIYKEGSITDDHKFIILKFLSERDSVVRAR